MSVLFYLKVYIFGLFRALQFYFKPGVLYREYPQHADPRKNKYFQACLKYIPAARSGIRKAWITYNQIMVEKDINKFNLLLKEVGNMINSVQSGKSFHISMSKSEAVLSLKKLAMNIYYEVGILYGYNQNYDDELDYYDRAAQMQNRDDPGCMELTPTKDKIYKNIRNYFATRQEEMHYDVLLINAGMIPSPIMPWSLIILATYLKKAGVTVRIMDDFSEEYEMIRAAKSASLIGFSVMSAQIGPSLKLSRLIKKHSPDKFVVWGGVHPTLFPEQCLQEDSIDFIVRGDGEDALTRLSNCVKNRDFKIADIPSLGYKDNGTIRVNPFGDPVRFEDAGPWALELLDMQNYLSCSFMRTDSKHPSISFISARGCPRNCTFCINSVISQTRIHRARAVDSVLDEIEQLIHKYHIRTFNFIDEAFFINPKNFASFVEGILKRNLKFEWGGTCHIADILRNKELIISAKKAGLIYLSGSGESGSNRLLKLINKGITVENILECSHFLANNGLITGSSYMMYLPTETPEETKATLDLVQQVKNIFREKNNPSYIMGPAVFRPYPGSKLYEMCVESGFKQPETLEDWGNMTLWTGEFKLDNITWCNGKIK